MSVYFGERDGARLFRYGTGITQPGDDYQAEFETWDWAPGGEMGDVLFRIASFSFAYDNGYHIGLTPVVDGVALAENVFTGTGVSTTGQAQYFFAQRGTRCSLRVRTLSRTGQLKPMNVQLSGVVLRQVP